MDYAEICLAISWVALVIAWANSVWNVRGLSKRLRQSELRTAENIETLRRLKLEGESLIRMRVLLENGDVEGYKREKERCYGYPVGNA